MSQGDYIAGQFRPVQNADGEITSVSPRDFGDVVDRVPHALSSVDEAVAAARQAWPRWAALTLEQRAKHLHALRDELVRRQQELAERICRELGKPLWEALGEAKACAAKVGVTLEDGMRLVDAVELAGGSGRYAFKPLGVAAVLGPFNFPAHLVNGHVIPALATGNTVVVKPSELTPSVGELYAECVHAAGLPAGVFNLVQGPGDTGAALAAHRGVDAVMFTGSSAVGQAIKRATLDQPHKLLALEMGGRNPAVVMADADLDKAVHDVLWGAFVSAGQRCTGTAVAYVERSLMDRFQQHLLSKLDGIHVGDPRATDTFMGPLVSEAARDRAQAALEAARAAGVTALRAPTIPSIAPTGAYITPSVHLLDGDTGIPYEREELFGPDLALCAFDQLDGLIEQLNSSAYGLSVSLFTAREALFERAWSQLSYGCVNWNAPTCGASSRLPFGGVRASGNHRPAALFSTLYCTYPVATLRGAAQLDVSALSPGLRW